MAGMGEELGTYLVKRPFHNAQEVAPNCEAPDASRNMPRAFIGERGPIGMTSVSTVGGSSLATLDGSPSIVMTSPRGANKKVVLSSLCVNDSFNPTATLCASRRRNAQPPPS